MNRLIIRIIDGVVHEVIHDIPNLNIEVLDEDSEINAGFTFVFFDETDSIASAIYQYEGNISKLEPTRVNYIFNQLYRHE